MSFGIGIDTGGTYTDAVLYDFDAGAVAARAKALTDSGDLSGSIDRALAGLPEDCFADVASVAISTTLATNACVEGKGGRARLVLVGVPEELLIKADADRYGFGPGDVLCVPARTSFDGTVAEPVDWDAVIAAHPDFFSEAEALGTAAMNAVRNGGVHELAAQKALTARFPVPFVRAGELAGELNVLERGATALLNAKLLPLVQGFMRSVQAQLDKRRIPCRYMTVRSDGGLMGPEAAALKPVETILSGPAASVVGARTLAGGGDCLVVDIGGTTTDIAVIQDGAPLMTDQIRIGGWRTQIRGVSIETYALGGDSRLRVQTGTLAMDPRRVKPLCALASEHPEILAPLQELVDLRRQHTLPIYEFLELARPDADESRFTPAEVRVIRALRDGPAMLGGGAFDLYSLDTERLEAEGVVQRCGLTPTDIMHLTGDFQAFDARASRLAAHFFLRNLTAYADNEKDLERFCQDALDQFRHALFQRVSAALMRAAFPNIFRGAALDGQFAAWFEALWRGEKPEGPLCALALQPRAKLVGIGAPTHVFLPRVAAALGMECVIPADASVANAVGAITAGVSAHVVVRVRPDVEGGFALHGPGLAAHYDEYEDALAAARDAAARLAAAQAATLGAPPDTPVRLDVVRQTGYTKSGAPVDLGTEVRAASGNRLR